MTSWEGKRAITVVTACMNALGMPDFALNEVEVTHEEYENGVHIDLVEDRLVDERYDEPYTHFDEFDAPAFLIPAVKKYLADDDEEGLEPFITETPNAARPV